MTAALVSSPDAPHAAPSGGHYCNSYYLALREFASLTVPEPLASLQSKLQSYLTEITANGQWVWDEAAVLRTVRQAVRKTWAGPQSWAQLERIARLVSGGGGGA